VGLFAQKETDLDGMHGDRAGRTVVDGSLRATGTWTSTDALARHDSRSIRLAYTCCHVIMHTIYSIDPLFRFFFRFLSPSFVADDSGLAAPSSSPFSLCFRFLDFFTSLLPSSAGEAAGSAGAAFCFAISLFLFLTFLSPGCSSVVASFTLSSAVSRFRFLLFPLGSAPFGVWLYTTSN
jgi:hypothetical protein